MIYYGMLRAEQDDVKTSLGSQLYEHWDRSSDAPPKTRQREPVSAPSLNALSWKDGRGHFPDAIVNKFQRGTDEHKKMLELKAEVEDLFAGPIVAVPSPPPPPETPTPTGLLSRKGSAQSQGALVDSTKSTPPRAVGRPDWEIEGGSRPPSVVKAIHLEHVAAASFGVPRFGGFGGESNLKFAIFLIEFCSCVGSQACVHCWWQKQAYYRCEFYF